MHIKTLIFTAFALCGTVSMNACDDKKADDKKADAKKADDKKADDKKADDKKADAKEDAKADTKADPAPAADGDTLVITATHEPAKPDDPVKITFSGLKVIKAEFDPKDPAKGTFEIEIDPTTVDSGSEKRDGHLQTADYLDAEKFPAIKVTASDLVKVGDGWTAKIVVDAHGQQVTWAATPFTIVETTDDAIKVNLKKDFERTAFGVGKAKDDPAATKLSAELNMTIKKTN